MKLSNIVGGTGWHRYWLLEMTVRDFEKWWIAGMPMEETAHWFPYMLETTGGADITNEFVAFGLTAGIIAIILFVLLLIKAFGVVGQAMASAKFKSGDSTNRYFIWGVGVMIVVHIANWFGVSYYDQIKLVWYMHLSLIAMLADIIKTTRRSSDDIDPKEEHSIQA
jgi:hypothetical protein